MEEQPGIRAILKAGEPDGELLPLFVFVQSDEERPVDFFGLSIYIPNGSLAPNREPPRDFHTFGERFIEAAGRDILVTLQYRYLWGVPGRGPLSRDLGVQQVTASPFWITTSQRAIIAWEIVRPKASRTRGAYLVEGSRFVPFLDKWTFGGDVPSPQRPPVPRPPS